MLRRLQAFLVMSVVSIPAVAVAAPEEAAEEATDTPTSDKPTSDDPQSARAGAAPAKVTLPATGTAPVAPPLSSEAKPEGLLEGWHTEVHGYFRAPMALGISSRPNPDQVYLRNPDGSTMLNPDGTPMLNPDAASHTQISYAPNRVMDWSYYSFAYTRLQEQDWAELTVHAKKKHVDAAVGWMGYWLSASGYRNADAAAVPGIASLALDTDFEVAGLKPNIECKMGAWWPSFGYFEKYDTFTLGRFRQIGEQLKLTVPLNPDLTATLVQGVGTGRDGSYNPIVAQNSPLYAAKTSADLIAYANLQVAYEKYADIGLHYNYEWTRDDRLTADASPTSGKAYSDAAAAHLSVIGAEANLSAPYAGRLWVSPSYISVKNGWALAGQGGTEVMHSQGGYGIATNYMALTNSISDSAGTGSMFNLGFLYENTLSNMLGKAPGSVPDVRLNVFGLLANASLDLPTGSKTTQNSIKQFKYGADVTVQAVSWLALMLRGDTVNYDLDHPGFIFSAITSRLAFSSHFLSGESIYLQYSRYIYGDKMVLAGNWPWGSPLVAGTDVLQNYGNPSYFGKTPDANVIKLQATIAF
jgi:hypothetical protein